MIDFGELREYIYPNTSAYVEEDPEDDDENRISIPKPVLRSSITNYETV